MTRSYDVIVVGGGHAGCEAAMAASGMGSHTLLISMDMNGFAKMSCNPAIGGIAKGQIVREIDALGGFTGLVTDACTLQFRMLNRSKGPAMWSPRAQCDKALFSRTWRKVLETHSLLDIYEDLAVEFLFEKGKIAGVRTLTGAIFHSRAVILTAGTFLGGNLFVGQTQFEGGRIGEKASYGITQQLVSMGIPSDRMKTGTPPRIDIRSVPTEKLIRQDGDERPARFSYLPIPSSVQASGNQMPCYIVHTNERVHDILRTGFDRSPLFTGMIHGRGPRYCPSIEDKLRTFSDKDSHLLFLEPEGREINEYYLQGFSSSLPLDVQVEALHAIEGLENGIIYKPAYAVEYDFFDPTYLTASLQSRVVEGLFLAGQVNGTTGYEEAAAQGIIAGVNAHLFISGRDPFVLRRDEAYIGVLIDDLITKGVDEPYRMFTSRAEYRILLRQDDADARLTKRSYEIGLATEDRLRYTEEKYSRISELRELCETVKLSPDIINPLLSEKGSSEVSESHKVTDFIGRPELNIDDVLRIVPRGTFDSFLEDSYEAQEIRDAVGIAVKYEGYIERERLQADKVSRLEYVKIPADFDFDSVSSLSIECRQKLKKYKPETIAQASRISGVSPADVSILLVYFGR